MKKSLALTLIFILLLFCGCEKKADKKPTNAPQASSSPITKNWFFLDTDRGSHDMLSFKKDGTFAYYCEAGEPVGDSDSYDFYRYDEKNSQIILYNEYDENEKIINILDLNVSNLLLRIDGEIRDFIASEMDTTSNFWWEKAPEYLEGYNLYRAITDIKDGKVITAAFNYDSETDHPKDTFKEFTLSDDAVYFDLTIFSQMEVTDGLANELYYEVSYNEISLLDFEAYFENGAPTAFMWLSDDMEIEKIVVFGMTTVTENAKN